MANNISFKPSHYAYNPYISEQTQEQMPAQYYSPYLHYVPDFIKKMMPDIKIKDNPFPQNVEYKGDIYEKQKDDSDKEFLYKASDGKEYSLKENVISRLKNFCYYESENRIRRCLRYFFREKLHIGYSFKNVDDSQIRELQIIGINTTEDDCKPVENAEEMFYELTGYEYTKENAEKFLIGEILLKSEKAAEKYLKKNITHSPMSIPYVSKYYMNERNFNLSKELRTELNENEVEKYNEIMDFLDSDYQTKFENVLKNGQLLRNDSDNNITVLESLHKILTEPRAGKLENKKILEECIDILDTPYIITQRGENIPEEYQKECMKRYAAYQIDTNEQNNMILRKYMISKMKNNPYKTADAKFMLRFPVQMSLKNNPINPEIIPEKYTKEFKHKIYVNEAAKNLMKSPLKKQFFDYRGLGTCAAASIEYYLASEYSAQFFEMVEALTSEQKKYTKTVNLDQLDSYNSGNTVVSMMSELPKTHQLDEFKTKYTLKDENNAEVEITSDKNAYFLAEITAENRTEDTRSITDIIMQSAIMNLGSGGTYESISDIRQPSKYTTDNSGLIQEECNYVLKTILQNPLNLYVYKDNNMQNIYTKEDMKNSILDALNRNGSVVAGYVFGSAEYGYGGHEITIVGYTKNMNGDGFFIIQDSDDLEPQKPVLIQENELLEELQHAFL